MQLMSRPWRDAWIELSAANLRHNARAVAELVAPTELMAVVKANAYGHGVEACVPTLLDAGVSRFGVATVTEGAELRSLAPEETILVLSLTSSDELPLAIEAGLTVTVDSIAGVDALAKAAAISDRPVSVHLKVDTGMHRLGSRLEFVPTIASAIVKNDRLSLDGVFTHFATADEDERSYTNGQIRNFVDTLEEMSKLVGRPPIVHAANSAGALAYPQARFNMVRVGIALYGIKPNPEFVSPVELRPVMSVKARVSHVTRMSAAERISYGLQYVFERDGFACTIPLGYADGVPRNLGVLGGEVLFRGKRRAVAGMVTMDQTMFAVYDEEPMVGEEVVLIGTQHTDESGLQSVQHDAIPAAIHVQPDAISAEIHAQLDAISIDEWSRLTGTISYEHACHLGARLPRLSLRD